MGDVKAENFQEGITWSSSGKYKETFQSSIGNEERVAQRIGSSPRGMEMGELYRFSSPVWKYSDIGIRKTHALVDAKILRN